MMESSRTTRHFSARSLLPIGFCAVFLLMAAAMVETYRMQETIQGAPAAFAIYDRDAALIEHIRNGFNQSQNLVRAFLVTSGAPEGFLASLSTCESEVLDAFDQIGHKEMFEGIVRARAGFQDYFQALHGVGSWPASKRRQDGPLFIGTQLPSLRAPGNRIVRDMAAANQNGRRRQATATLAGGAATVRRIFVLLAADLILALCVAGLNLAYARELGHESQSKVQEIARAKGEMQQLSARLLTIQEEERHRLSRDLHDGIGQLLTALRIEISHLGHEDSAQLTPQDRERLQRARSLAEEAVRHTRDIALLLRPSHLDDLGLEAALQWQTEDFGRRTGILCQFSAAGLQENLPDAWKTCVYRIVQEALHNCEKHAAPKQVRVCVNQEPDRLTLEVEDDGVGFELNAQGAPLRAVGLGLLGMRERAAMLGGTVRITSAPGHGAAVRVELPVSALSSRNSAAPAAEESARREVEA
jgi:signal transduction histidine kinase